MHPRVFFVANHFQVEIKTRGACNAREHENCTDGTLGEGTHSVGDTGFAHLALGVVNKKEERLSVGVIGMHLATNPCIPRMVLILPCWEKRKR